MGPTVTNMDVEPHGTFDEDVTAEDPQQSLVGEASGVVDPGADDVDSAPVHADDAIRYFGADFDVDGLVKRLNDGTFIIPTFDPQVDGDVGEFAGFQRGLVWKKKQMDRFIESILLGYPVPGIFLVELSDRRYLVLDGQQRLTTLQAFKRGKYWARNGERRFALRHASDEFKGQGYETLEDRSRRLFDNTFIPATIVVPKGDDGKSGVYSLFERINSGGTNLKPQQIRVALYAGATVNFVRDLNQDPSWRALFGPHNRDLKDHELILRALALMPAAKGRLTFKPPMATFLNSYLSAHQNRLPPDADSLQARFSKAVRLLDQARGSDALRIRGTQVNAAHTDAVLVGLMTVLEENSGLSVDDVDAALSALHRNSRYQYSVSESTSHSEQVVARIRLAVRAFQGDPLDDEQR